MDKKIILQKIVEKLNENLRIAEGNVNTYKKFSSEAPGAMESHSDTSRFQYGALASDAESRLREIENAIKVIQNAGDKLFHEISMGALVKLEGEEKEIYYLIVPEGAGGQKVEYGGITVQTVPDNSPVGKGVLHKKAGDNVAVQIAGRAAKFNILEVL